MVSSAKRGGKKGMETQTTEREKSGIDSQMRVRYQDVQHDEGEGGVRKVRG